VTREIREELEAVLKVLESLLELHRAIIKGRHTSIQRRESRARDDEG
jgi:hypothetical protein